jgi:hypothetical protein
VGHDKNDLYTTIWCGIGFAAPDFMSLRVRKWHPLKITHVMHTRGHMTLIELPGFSYHPEKLPLSTTRPLIIAQSGPNRGVRSPIFRVPKRAARTLIS